MRWISVRGARPRRINTREIEAVKPPMSDAELVSKIAESSWERAMRKAAESNARMGIK